MIKTCRRPETGAVRQPEESRVVTDVVMIIRTAMRVARRETNRAGREEFMATNVGLGGSMTQEEWVVYRILSESSKISCVR